MVGGVAQHLVHLEAPDDARPSKDTMDRWLRSPIGFGCSLNTCLPATDGGDKLIGSLNFDPDQVDRVEPPGPRDFIICGCSRTGTSLLAAALFQPPEVVTVMEPWDGLGMSPAELFASLRDEIGRDHRLTRGRLDIAALEETRQVRWVRDGAAPQELNVDGSFLL